MSTATQMEQSPSPAAWWEISLVIVLSVAISLLAPALKTLAVLLPAAYFLFERRMRKRSWAESGFNLRAYPRDLLSNLGLVLLVGAGTQALAILGSYLFLPEFSAHIVERLPFGVQSIPAVVISLLLATLGEEVVFRALFQKRLSDFLSLPAAIAVTSAVFALMHFSPGPAAVVAADLAFIFLDSLIYGLIFARSNNAFVAWSAHFLADIVGLGLLLLVA